MPLSIYGIRHHGPGCSKALRAALQRHPPDILLIEGPPDADDVLPLIAHDDMTPPVALLVYRPDDPRRAVFYPFAIFSPEWQAARFALDRRIPVRFIDLPVAHRLADDAARHGIAADAVPSESHPPAAEPPADDEHHAAQPAADDRASDPLAALAMAAGYDDHELWWDHQIEHRRDAAGLFEAIHGALAALRGESPGENRETLLREAHMRQCIRAAIREGHEHVAAVCGAWHAPALNVDRHASKDDAALLRGLPQSKVAATWIPWTHDRLSFRSGYGAGVRSPGWYEHLWTAPDQAAIRWAASAARLLRDEDLPASSAQVIDAVRLADALAALRDRPAPGLDELNESVFTVLCRGESAPMTLIHRKLEVGQRLGRVPESSPAVPLQRDLEAAQRALRLRPDPAARLLDLDLREPTGLGRSRLLHRLNLLGIPWGLLQPVHGKAGTFHEIWQLQWDPEFAVRIIEAAVWGRTVASAAEARARHDAAAAARLADITRLLDRTILADLPDAAAHILVALQDRAARSTDVPHLMEALPPLARIARYGDVRGSEGGAVRAIADGLFERIIVGLPPACASLDDEAAAAMLGRLRDVQEAINMLDASDWRTEWQTTLRRLSRTTHAAGGAGARHDADGPHGHVQGGCVRLLLEQDAVTADELHRLTRLSLSRAVSAQQAAAWIEGLVSGSGMVLLHHDGVWSALNGWLSELSGEAFVETLPLLRRAFADFTPPERRAMGEKAAALARSGAAHAAPVATAQPRPGAAPSLALDEARAARVLPALAKLLGVTGDRDDAQT